MDPANSKSSRLYFASWAIVVYTVLIIGWGAWVRISGSGAGCGDHWPLCHGRAIPSAANIKTWTEVSHRYSTALFGILVIAQLFAIRRLTPKHNPARFWIIWTLFFTATEALIGRMLVKQGLVHESQAISRMIAMPLHLVNTSLLLFSQVMTAESIAWGERKLIALTSRQRRWIGISVALGALLLTTGAIAALGSHLMPATSLQEGLAHDLQVDSHPAVRLRLLHPLLGLLVPLTIWFFCSHLTSRATTARLATMYRNFGISVLAMVVIGVLTLTLLAPTWLKLAHLTLANVLVILGSRCIFHTLRPTK
jgi:cytochrome c oxidase assembly protein subunit 15